MEAKRRLNVPVLWRLLKLSGAPTRSTCCPFHEDSKASFSVYPNQRGELRWRCFAGCGGGGSVELVACALNLSTTEACRWLLHCARITSVAGVQHTLHRRKPSKSESARRTLRLSSRLHRGSRRDVVAVASLRGLSVAGVALARERGLLWFGSSCGFPAWFVTDGKRINAQARRMDGQMFPAFKALSARKAHTLSGSRAGWPVGTREAADKPFVVLTEGGPDLLAGWHFVAVEDRESDVAVVSMLGASNSIPEDALSLLANKRARIFPHADSAGHQAAIRWTAQLERVGCTVDAFSFDGLRRYDGDAVGDLNDLALIDVDSFELERAELTEVLPR